MTPNEYQKEAMATALPSANNLTYMMLGLANESGEAVGKLKKIIRGDSTLEEQKEAIAYELGDVLWYVAGAANSIGYDMEAIMDMNISKLLRRRDAGTIQGDGDNR